MGVERIEYRGWTNAYRLTNDAAELVLVTDIGPRVMSLRVHEGENILYNDAGALGLADGHQQWRSYGGHRLWVSPESARCYAPDNAPCDVSVGADWVEATQPDATHGLARTMRVEVGADRFRIVHRVTNTTDLFDTGALWALTCVRPDGRLVFPWATGGDWSLKKIVFWDCWAGHGSDARSVQYQPGDQLYVIEPSGEQGKVGTTGTQAWMGYAGHGVFFHKTFTHVPDQPYPDDNCAIQVYTCADFCEMETLGPLGTFLPGRSRQHVEQWFIRPGDVDPHDEAAVLAIVGARP